MGGRWLQRLSVEFANVAAAAATVGDIEIDWWHPLLASVVVNSLTERGEFKIVDTPVYKAVWQIGLGEGPFLPLSEISPIPPSPSYPPSLRIDR